MGSEKRGLDLDATRAKALELLKITTEPAMDLSAAFQAMERFSHLASMAHLEALARMRASAAVLRALDDLAILGAALRELVDTTRTALERISGIDPVDRAAKAARLDKWAKAGEMAVRFAALVMGAPDPKQEGGSCRRN